MELNIAQVAGFLDVSPARIYELARAGKFRY